LLADNGGKVCAEGRGESRGYNKKEELKKGKGSPNKYSEGGTARWGDLLVKRRSEKRLTLDTNHKRGGGEKVTLRDQSSALRGEV